MSVKYCEKKSLVVTTDKDVVDAYDGVISLREAVMYANNGTRAEDGTATITFDDSLGDSINIVWNTILGHIELTSGVYADETLTIDGQDKVTITGGESSDGVFLIRSSNNITIKNMDFSGHKDGTIILNQGTLLAENCSISNSTTGYCAGIWTQSGNTTIKNCQFSNNSVTENSAAVRNERGTVTIEDSYFYNNHADGHGGAIHNVFSSATMTIKNTVFESNSSNKGGGAIYNFNNAFVSLDGCTFIDNEATYGLSLWNGSNSTSFTVNSDFYGNNTDAALSFTVSDENVSVDGNILSATWNELENVSHVIKIDGTIIEVNTPSYSGKLTAGEHEVYVGHKDSNNNYAWGKKNTVSATGIIEIYSSSTLVKTAQEVTGEIIAGGGYDTMYINGGGIAQETTINAQGKIIVRSGGFAQNTKNNTGKMYVSNGGIVSNTILNDFGTLYVSSGATANNTSAINCGQLVVIDSGIVQKNNINGGGMYVSSGGIADDTIVTNKGYLYVSSGGTATNIIVDLGGKLLITVAPNTYAQGTSSGTAFEMKDATLNDYTINNGYLYVSSGGKVNNIILDNGEFGVFSAGMASDITINSGGRMFVSSAGIVSGKLKIESEASVSAYQGAIIDFTIANQDTTENALINNWSLIQGKELVNYTITVNVNQAYGTYQLAGGAENFSQTITVKSVEGIEIGSVSLEQSLTIENTKYLLNVIDSNLVFTVASATVDLTAPILSAWQVNDTVFASAMDISSVALFQYNVDGCTDWQIYDVNTGVKVTSTNGQVIFKATDTNGNTSDITYTLNTDLLSSTHDAIGSQQVHWDLPYDAQAAKVTIQDNDKAMSFMINAQDVSVLGAKNGMQISVQDSQGNPLGKLNLENTISEGAETKPREMEAGKADGITDIFFAGTNGVWENGYIAEHTGYLKDGELYTGTTERVELEGKNIVCDIFSGAADANVLFLTDDTNGDSLFVEDIYSESTGDLGKVQSRITQIKEVYAGIGDDIVDMTSQRFEYQGDGLVIHGGTGDDIIWSNVGSNTLFGDAGNDRLVGASDNDVLVGGIGNDSMHGGGGEDIFCFCENWGQDTIEQLATGKVTLWFVAGDEQKFNWDTLTYTDGANTVSVSGVSMDDITLKFGDDDSEMYDTLLAEGAFNEFTSEYIFEKQDKEQLAG